VSRSALIYHCDTLELTFSTTISWKLPFALQWIWPVPLFIMACFVPQSPWWLVRQGRYQDAERSVARLTDAEHYSELEVKQSVAMMIHTTEMEKQTTAGASYIGDCHDGVRRVSRGSLMLTQDTC
jgi:SP family general alpha glucoside:H+ symporter-like MFS transporter